MSTAINIESLFKTYPDGTQALKGVNLSVEKGGFFALLGPNGAGKSTLIKLVTTLYKKDEGHLMIDGSDPDIDFKRVQRAIGVASQDNELDPGETVMALLRFQGRLFGLSKTEANKRAEELIDLFDLQPVSDKRTADLSGGNKRRLHCALALVHKPSILFLDEPTVGMDPLARSLFWEVTLCGFSAGVMLRTGQPQSAAIVTNAVFPLLFLSTTFLPRELMTAKWLLAISWGNPVTYVLEGCRYLLAGTSQPIFLLIALCILSLTALSSVIFALNSASKIRR